MPRAKKENKEQEVTPQYLHQVKLAKEKEEMKKRFEIDEDSIYYSLKNNKLIKHYKKACGSGYSEFICMVKTADDHKKVQKLKDQGVEIKGF